MNPVNSTRSSNTTTYEPNSCETTPPATQTGERHTAALDSVGYDGDTPDGYECSATGLRGPATAVELYAAALNAEATPRWDDERGVSALVQTKETTQAAQAASAAARLADVRDAALHELRTLVATLTPEAGHEFSRSIELPNGCEMSVGIGAERDANGELVTNAMGRIQASAGAVMAEVEFSYSVSQSGEEAVTFEACIFGGVDQALGLGNAEAKAGVCGTYTDTSSEGAVLQVDAVAQIGAGIDLQLLQWEYEVQVRQPLSRETMPFDVIR